MNMYWIKKRMCFNNTSSQLRDSKIVFNKTKENNLIMKG